MNVCLLFGKRLTALGIIVMLLFHAGAYGQELAVAGERAFRDSAPHNTVKPLQEVLKKIEKHFNIYLNYEVDLIKDKLVQAGDQPSDFPSAEEALKNILPAVDLKHEVVRNNFYVIYSAQEAAHNSLKVNDATAVNTDQQPHHLNSLTIESTQIAGGADQPIDVAVKGKVTGQDDGTALPGVNIVVKGTTMGTTTDIDGNYSLVVPDDAVLIFSFIGYTTEEIPVNNRSVINVVMMSDITSLSEVVIVGYGEQKREEVLGAVVNITPKEILDIPAGNLSTLLQGRLAGVSVGQSSGRPGASTPINIRTSSTYGGEIGPLFVIDGFIREEGQAAFDLLDPSEVESISVLKDASAAVYGVRGAAGVVLVKTKRGKEGKAKINYSGSYGTAQPRQIVEMMSAYDHAVLLNDVTRYENPDSYADHSDYYTEDELEHFKKNDHNWLDEALGAATTVRQTLNISGGSDKVRYFGGGSYYKEEGSLPGTKYQKYTLRLGLDADITKDLTASLMLSSGNNIDRRPFNREDGGNYNVMNGTYEALLMTPRWIPSYIDGLPVGQYGTVENHPLEVNNINSYAMTEGTNTVVNSSLEYKVPFVEGLSVKAAYSLSKKNETGKSYRVGYNLYNFETAGAHNHIITDVLDEGNPFKRIKNDDRLFLSNSIGKSYQLNFNLAYDRSFGLHGLSALIVYEQAETEGFGFDTQREGMVVENFEHFGAFSEDEVGNRSNASQSGRLSYIGRLNYNYDKKYLLEASFRYEGSQKFAPEDRWGFFPAVAVGWRISEESFFKNNVSFMNNLKLRLSGGVLGSDQIGGRQWERSFSTRDGAYLGGNNKTNAIQNRNEGLALRGSTWEKTASYNGGLEMGFANNITVQFDAYYRYTWDILGQRGSTLPNAVGIKKTPNENYGKMSSKGFDASIAYNGTAGDDFRYDVGVNMHWGRSKIIEKFQSPAIYGTWQDEIGKMPNGETGFYALGMFRTQEQLDAFMEENPGYTLWDMEPQLGMIYYKDVGGPDFSNVPDGKINDDDERIIAPSVNALGFGINIGASWKGLRLSTNLGLSGLGTYDFYDKEAMTAPEKDQNGPAFWKDHWTPENPDAAYPSPVPAFEDVNRQRSTFWMRKGLDLTLNMINASYQLPTALSEKLGVPQIRVYFSGRNMWRIINSLEYKDPSLSRFNTYPIMRSFNFGLNVSL